MLRNGLQEIMCSLVICISLLISLSVLFLKRENSLITVLTILVDPKACPDSLFFLCNLYMFCCNCFGILVGQHRLFLGFNFSLLISSSVCHTPAFRFDESGFELFSWILEFCHFSLLYSSVPNLVGYPRTWWPDSVGSSAKLVTTAL